jgi:methyltransferase (TIGR00027 family)
MVAPGPQRPSRTARIVAAARGVGTAEAHDPLAEVVLPDRDASVTAILRSGVSRSRLVDLAARTVTGGLTTHAVRRMAAVDEAVGGAVAAGCQQVVLLGAGLDTRAWRLEALAATVVYEVDRPSIQSAKRRRLAGRVPLTEVRFVAADLAVQDLDAELDAAGHDASLPTAWIWEAVIVYLPRGAVEATLAVIGARSARGSHLALTFVLPAPLGTSRLAPLAMPVLRMVFDRLGEPLRTTYTEDEVGRELRAVGFGSVRFTDLRHAGPRSSRVDLFAAERLASGTIGGANEG